ncbi:RNA-3'-phosphate cyclase [Coprinopsis cinerea okayama7|uniref:RNA-3'-phosphate cyclase n=1 Tax=Coprinopsis cinerea (strain Okayama-7 / 130 / ATCC MYA-4618 / FGSC 9003) TaxID=240176 RepID=A8NEW9_COPC7|nr:RNA-3'-phosphate cyclase [Coprinopsis cinerea okayama7\|eukprot:XP_001833150.2 RNA-3'-phosphate cyclase [Coprinopsis cinerea okayama7\
MAQPITLLAFSGHEHLRTRVVLSVLSGKQVKIDKIRSDDKNPGLREPIIMLAPFAKRPFQLTLRGITTDEHDLSVDLLRTVTLPHLQFFGISDGLELRIKKRGDPPLGGGEVQFLCPIVKQVKTLNFVEPGKIKRIRGVAHAVRVNPQFSNRMIEAARSVLNRYIPDIYLYSDVYKGEESGKSPGYALSLLAESTTGALHCAEAASEPGVVPEDIALKATRALLTEIEKGGCVDRKHQCLVLLYMVLGSEDVGRCVMGEPTPRTIQFLRDVKEFFATSFKIASADPSDPECKQLTYSCYGTGYATDITEGPYYPQYQPFRDCEGLTVAPLLQTRRST